MRRTDDLLGVWQLLQCEFGVNQIGCGAPRVCDSPSVVPRSSATVAGCVIFPITVIQLCDASSS